MPKKLGECRCPLPPCGKEGAEVMEGEKGTPYIRCDHCGSMIRTMTRGVKDWMRAQAKNAPERLNDVPQKPAKPGDKKPDAEPAKKPRGALSFLTGGD